MTLTPLLKVILVMNNYFHDVATALLLASAVIMWVLMRKAEEEGPGAVALLASAYPVLTRFAKGAIAWIILGGIPRTVFFAQLEWNPATTKYMVPALAVKHMLMAAAVVAGVFLWARARRRIAGISAEDTARVSAPSGI